MEAKHPPFHARMVPVHIPGMIDTGQHPNALSQVDRPVDQSHFAGHQGEGTLSSDVVAKDGIMGQKWFQDNFDRLVVVLRENRIGSSERSLKSCVTLYHLNQIALSRSNNEAAEQMNTAWNSLFQSWTAIPEKQA